MMFPVAVSGSAGATSSGTGIVSGNAGGVSKSDATCMRTTVSIVTDETSDASRLGMTAGRTLANRTPWRACRKS